MDISELRDQIDDTDRQMVELYCRRMDIAEKIGRFKRENGLPVLDSERERNLLNRVAELADKRGVTMTEISLAWLLTKVASPVVGATKFHHVDGAAKAVDLELTEDEIAYLEAPYVPHPLAGVMAQNRPSNAGEKHVWSTGNQKI